MTTIGDRRFWLDVIDLELSRMRTESKRNLELAQRLSESVLHLSEAVKGLHAEEEGAQRITLTNLTREDIDNIKKVLTPNTAERSRG